MLRGPLRRLSADDADLAAAFDGREFDVIDFLGLLGADDFVKIGRLRLALRSARSSIRASRATTMASGEILGEGPTAGHAYA